MNYFLLLWLLLSGLFLGGCSPSPGQPPRPADFSITYRWVAASVPRPYHYEYTIRIGPGLQGVIEYQPDYAFPSTPIWTETFDLKDEDLDKVYTLMWTKGVFTRFWQPVDPKPIPGELSPLVVTADGQQVVVSAYTVEGRADGSILDIYNALPSLVPGATWQKLEAQRKQYMQDFVAGQEAVSPQNTTGSTPPQN